MVINGFQAHISLWPAINLSSSSWWLRAHTHDLQQLKLRLVTFNQFEVVYHLEWFSIAHFNALQKGINLGANNSFSEKNQTTHVFMKLPSFSPKVMWIVDFENKTFRFKWFSRNIMYFLTKEVNEIRFSVLCKQNWDLLYLYFRINFQRKLL